MRWQSDSIIHVAQHVHRVGGLETLVLDLMSASQFPSYCLGLEGEGTSNGVAFDAQESAVRTMGKAPGRDFGLLARLVEVFRTVRPRAVVAHHIGPLLYGGVAARAARVPALIYYEHDIWHYEQARDRRIAWWCMRVLRPRAIAVSDEAAAYMRDHFGGGPVTVVPPGVDTDRFIIGDRSEARRRLGLPVEARIVGNVGRLAAVKGQADLIDAFAALPADVLLVLVGDGAERSALEQRAQSLGLRERVQFLGQRNDLEHVLPAFDVFSLPSHAEGLPRALLEAMACGVPVVATDVGAVAKALPASAGALVPPQNPAAMADAIRRQLARAHDPLAIRAAVAGRYTLAAATAAVDRLSRSKFER